MVTKPTSTIIRVSALFSQSFSNCHHRQPSSRWGVRFNGRRIANSFEQLTGGFEVGGFAGGEGVFGGEEFASESFGQERRFEAVDESLRLSPARDIATMADRFIGGL